jgi:hypothetical protein
VSAHGEAFGRERPVFETLLGRETTRNLDHLMSSSCRLVLKEGKESSKSAIGSAFRQMTMLEHAGDVQGLHTDARIALCVRLVGLADAPR